MRVVSGVWMLSETGLGMNKIYMGGEFFRKATLKKERLDPLACSQLQLLTVIFGDESVALGIDQASNGNVLDLSDVPLRALPGLPGIGPGAAGRIIALFEIIRRAREHQDDHLERDHLDLLKGSMSRDDVA